MHEQCDPNDLEALYRSAISLEIIKDFKNQVAVFSLQHESLV
jgi:hypothetical protein